MQLDEIQRKINSESVAEYNADLVRNTLSDFKATFDNLGLNEKAQALQYVLKDVIIYPDKIVLDIFELPEFCIGSKNRIKKLPVCNDQHDGFRSFSFSRR